MTVARQPGLRDRRRQETQRRILDAARALFGEAGFERVGLEEVAARADVVRPTIYRHFGSKLGLLHALVSDAEQRAGIDHVLAAIEEPDAAVAVQRMLSELCRFWAAEERIFRQVIGRAAADPEALEVIEAKEASRRRDLARLAARLHRQGRLGRGWSQRRAAEALWLLTSFTAYDHLARRSGLGRAGAERTLHELARALVQ